MNSGHIKPFLVNLSKAGTWQMQTKHLAPQVSTLDRFYCNFLENIIFDLEIGIPKVHPVQILSFSVY